MGYASRIFRRDPDSQGQWKATYSQAGPPRICRTGLAFPLENGRWMVTLAGGGGDYPPTEEEGFAEFAKSLPNPGIYHVIRTSEPLTPIRGSRGTENRLRHWERLRLPSGLAVLGDAACAFNPVYGQGITTAAIAAELLDESLTNRALHGFQKRLTKAVQFAWTLSTGEDMRYPGVEGRTGGLALQLMHRYLDAVVALSLRNTDVRSDLLGVFHMVRNPSVLFRPGTVGRVLKDWLFRPDVDRLSDSAPARA
jgi:flavin-dependent dehydrogenase